MIQADLQMKNQVVLNLMSDNLYVRTAFGKVTFTVGFALAETISISMACHPNVIGNTITVEQIGKMAITLIVDEFMKTKHGLMILGLSLLPLCTFGVNNSDIIFKQGFEVITDPQDLPLADMNSLQSRYAGAFRTNVGSYIRGTIAVNSDNNSLFVTAVEGDFSVGEYSIPTPSMSTDFNQLPISNTLQAPVPLLDRIPESSWSTKPLENSMMSLYFKDNQLLVNAALYYDANTTNTDTTFRISNAADLANSAIVGNFTVEGLQHTTGWIAEIPTAWQTLLGKDHLLGGGFGLPIVGRLSFGPSMFAVNLADLINADTNENVATIDWIDYPPEAPIGGNFDLLNYGGATGGENNTLYTIMSVPSFGFIVPNTRTYMVVGGSSGHRSRAPGSTPYVGEVNDFAYQNGTIFYKDTIKPIEPRQDTEGNLAEGYLTYDATDKGPYYWLFDLNAILKAATPNDVISYDEGYFPAPFPVQPGASRSFNVPLSGSWDATNQKLYLSWPQMQPTVDGYNQSPVITVYQF